MIPACGGLTRFCTMYGMSACQLVHVCNGRLRTDATTGGAATSVACPAMTADGKGGGVSPEVANAIWYFVHGLVVVVILLAIASTDRSTRLMAHATWYRWRAWMSRQCGSSTASYSTVAQPGQTRSQQKGGGRLAAVAVGVPKFGRAKGAKPGRQQSLPHPVASDDEDEEEDEDEAPLTNSSRRNGGAPRSAVVAPSRAKPPKPARARAGGAVHAPPPSSRPEMKRAVSNEIESGSDDESD